MKNKYQPVIGLEIHVELRTKSKMFCQCSANYFGQKPNSKVCPVCLGLPGALPVPNKKAIEWTILIGQALGCKINRTSKFDRKHYFYPDLPKGYQISQYDEPIANQGGLKLKIKNEKLKIEEKQFRICRVHLEEDTGKLLHSGSDTLIDFNRSGVPLVEIVTEPDFDNSEDVKRFLEELHTIIRYLDISDADMEKGSMRLEPNISLQKFPISLPALLRKALQAGNFQLSNKSPLTNHKYKTENSLPNYKVEVKNINSFRFVSQAIEYEIERQTEILEKGEVPAQETRGFDEKKGITYSQRTKEETHDYRYFPEPDIPPLQFSNEYIKKIKEQIPELPQTKLDKYIKEFGLKYQDAFILTREKALVVFFESVILKIKNQKLGRSIANLIINKKIPVDLPVEEFVKRALDLFSPKQIDAQVLDASINRLIEVNKKAVEDYQKGKQNSLMFLVGQVMREFKGKIDAKIVIEKIKEKLE